MDTFGTRYAYKKGRRGSPLTRKKLSVKQPVATVYANEFDDSPTEIMIQEKRKKTYYPVQHSIRPSSPKSSSKKGGRKNKRRTPRHMSIN